MHASLSALTVCLSQILIHITSGMRKMPPLLLRLRLQTSRGRLQLGQGPPQLQQPRMVQMTMMVAYCPQQLSCESLPYLVLCKASYSCVSDPVAPS